MTEAATRNQSPLVKTRCPRCGYDQAGVIRAWIDSCPLDGTCTECGVDFRWSDVAAGRLVGPQWLVEHAPPRRVPIAAVLTCLAAPFPFIIWRHVRMEHEVRLRRLAALFVGIAAIAYLIAAVSIVSRQCEQVRWGLTQADMLQKKGMLASKPPEWMPAYSFAVLHGLLLPLGKSWTAFRVQQKNAAPFAVQVQAPASQWKEFFATSTWIHQPVAIVPLVVGSCAAFACLPIARRRAKVRWEHLIRATAYLLAIVLATAPFWRFASSSALDGPFDMLVMARYQPTSMLIAAGLLTVWWYGTTRRYLRMTRPLAVAASVSAVGVLLGFGLVALLTLPGQFMS